MSGKKLPNPQSTVAAVGHAIALEVALMEKTAKGVNSVKKSGYEDPWQKLRLMEEKVQVMEKKEHDDFWQKFRQMQAMLGKQAETLEEQRQIILEQQKTIARFDFERAQLQKTVTRLEENTQNSLTLFVQKLDCCTKKLDEGLEQELENFFRNKHRERIEKFLETQSASAEGPAFVDSTKLFL